MPECATNREVLIPTKELIESDHDRTTPARISAIDRTLLRRSSSVVENECAAALSQRLNDFIDAAVTGAAAFDIGPIAPDPIGQPRKLFQKCGFTIVQNAFHDALDDGRAVTPHEL